MSIADYRKENPYLRINALEERLAQLEAELKESEKRVKKYRDERDRMLSQQQSVRSEMETAKQRFDV